MITIPGCLPHHDIKEAYYHHLMRPHNMWKIFEVAPHPDMNYARALARNTLGSYYDQMRGVRAVLTNMQTAIESPDLYDFTFHGNAALIIAAGPSLDEVIDTAAFEKAFKECLTIATDTVYQKLLDKGFVPHFVMTAERVTATSKFFEKTNPKTYTIRTLQSNPQLNGKEINPVFMLKEDVSFSRFFKWEMRRFHKCGASVSPSALGAAIGFGIKEIAFVGLDLCYHPKSYGAYSTLPNPINPMGLTTREQRLKEGAKEVLLANGGKSLTSSTWDGFALTIEGMVSKRKEYQIYNCSPLARKLHGIPNIPLNQFVDKIDRTGFLAKNDFQQATRQYKEDVEWKNSVKHWPARLENAALSFGSLVREEGFGPLMATCLAFNYHYAVWAEKTHGKEWRAGYEEAYSHRLIEDFWSFFKFNEL